LFVKDVSDRWTDGEQVLEANRIKVETMHGGLTQQKRVDLLNQFRYCDRNGARVLLISNIDLVGLDVSCVNILIMVVRELATIVKWRHLR
jgi:superfamily II DNA/RNA helicase